jgi:hypothetical protein
LLRPAVSIVQKAVAAEHPQRFLDAVTRQAMWIVQKRRGRAGEVGNQVAGPGRPTTMRQLLLAVVVLFGMVACSDDGETRPAQTTPQEDEVPSSEAPLRVTAGRYDAPTGPVPADLAGIQAEIEASLDAPDLLNIGEGTGQGAGLMFVYLRLGREHIADQLIARYGDVLRVAVGDMPWPLIEEHRSFDSCADPLPAGDAIDGLSAKVTVTEDEVKLGEEIAGSVVLTNDTTDPVVFTWGGAGVRGYLVEPGTDEPVGMFTGMETAQLSATPAPAGGESEPIRLVVGVVSCTPTVHTAVPPGRYEVVAVLNLEDGRTIRSAPAEVVISLP